MDVYGKITKPFWDDRAVAIVGGGPSLIDFDFERLRGAHVLAVKGAIINMPWADACFGMGDFRGWRDKLDGVQSRVYWLIEEPEKQPVPKNITFLKRLAGQGLSTDPSAIYSGGTSGFGAMQICLLKKAKRIILFGFDYDGEDANDKWLAWARHFSVYVTTINERGVSVVNACPQSAISCFQKCTLDDGVAALHKPLR
jgi:hypothetical protein